MKSQSLIATLVTSIALGLGSTAAMAETAADMSFDGMIAMPRIDKNKDGMVSKKEFLDMMAAVWDEKAKKMSIKFDRMSAEEFRQIVMYLRAGS
jgi:Ca2+-binding EF-hand superfamily protein